MRNTIKAITKSWKSPKVMTFSGKVIRFMTGFKILNPIEIRTAAVKIPQNPPFMLRPVNIFVVTNNATEFIAISCTNPFILLA